jgi:hypothetical protein
MIKDVGESGRRSVKKKTGKSIGKREIKKQFSEEDNMRGDGMLNA